MSPDPRDPLTGLEIRNESNQPVIDSDFVETQRRFSKFLEKSVAYGSKSEQSSIPGWLGARFSDVSSHANLDMKPRRLSVRALENIRKLRRGDHVLLSEIADVLGQKEDISASPSQDLRLVEGIDIRAVEGLVTPQFPQKAWEIVERKQKNVYRLRNNDIIVGLVRPERRNIGLLLDSGDDIVGSPDGIAVVRVKKKYAKTFPQLWLFQALRKEESRLQLWTESGGTSYGKLTPENISDVILRRPSDKEIKEQAREVQKWADSVQKLYKAWREIGTHRDRFPIINSPIFGLEPIDEPWEDV